MNAKPMKIAVLTSLTLSFACIVQAQPEAAQGELPPPPRFGGPPPPPRPLPLVVLEKYDLNNDGKLDEQERSELHKQIETAAVEPRPQFRGRKGPAHHPGPPPEILDQYDLDKDGRLDETVVASLLAVFDRRRDAELPAVNVERKRRVMQQNLAVEKYVEPDALIRADSQLDAAVRRAQTVARLRGHV